MDIQKQLAMAAVAKAHKRNGTKPPPESSGKPIAMKKTAIKTGADPKQSSKAKNAAAAAIASRIGGGSATGPAPVAKNDGVSASSATVDKYRKMLKMGVPAGAVRGKMSTEGIPPNVIEEVFSAGGGGGPSFSSSSTAATARPRPPQSTTKKGCGGSSTLTIKEERIAAQYRKMVKVGLPDGAIRHKMTSDGVSQKIQDSVLAGEVPEAGGGGPSSNRPALSGPPTSGGGTVSSLSQKEEKIAAQYRRMAKVGLPDGAIRHKMVSDGVPQNIQDSVLAGEAPSAPGQQAHPNGGGGNVPSSNGEGTTSRLSPAEEQTAAQYRKMIKMGLPDGAVIHKMSMDGMSRNIQDSVLAREVPATDVKISVPADGSAAAFAAGAAALRSAPKASPDSSSDGASAAPKGSPLAVAAAAAAVRLASGPRKSPRDVPQNPKPVSTENASGPGALAAAAVAAAALRTKRQDSNPMEQNPKLSSHKVNVSPAHMVTLKPRRPPNGAPQPRSTQTPVAPTLRPRSTPNPRQRSNNFPSRESPSPIRQDPTASTTLRSLGASPALEEESRRGPSISQNVSSLTPPRQSATPAETCAPVSNAPAPSTPTPSPTSQPQGAAIPAKRSTAAPVTPVEHRRVPVRDHDPELEQMPAQKPEAVSAIALDPDEEEVAEHYRSMVRNGRSMEEVEEEMGADGAPSRIQEAVLATSAPPLSHPPPTLPPASTFTTNNPTHVSEVADDDMVGSRSAAVPSSDRLVPMSAEPKFQPIPVVTPTKPSAVTLNENLNFKQPKEEPATASSTPAYKTNKKRRRKKTDKGTTVREDGAEQHCACTIM